jgi:DNA-binding NtrC family response regulator
MGCKTRTRKATDNASPSDWTSLRVPDEPRILIVCDDDSITERLQNAFREAGFISECAKSITAGCESARSGRFHVVVTAPVLSDGSWRRLVDIADHYDLGFVVVLVARVFDFNQWGEALQDGAFDVLDALHELPKAAEAAKRALWAAYLKGAGPSPEAVSPSKAA